MIFKRSQLLFLSIPILLLIPLIGMQISDEIQWSLVDFIFMGSLLFILAFGIEVILKSFKSIKKRLMFILLAGMIFILVWAELAVGIFGSPLAGH